MVSLDSRTLSRRGYAPVMLTEARPEPSVLTFPGKSARQSAKRNGQLTEITDVSLLVGRSTVVLLVGVEVGSSGSATVATSSVEEGD